MSWIPRLGCTVVSGMQKRLLQIIVLGSRPGCSGQDLIEYALMAGFVAVAIAGFIPYSVTAPISLIFTKIENFLVTRGNG